PGGLGVTDGPVAVRPVRSRLGARLRLLPMSLIPVKPGPTGGCRHWPGSAGSFGRRRGGAAGTRPRVVLTPDWSMRLTGEADNRPLASVAIVPNFRPERVTRQCGR